MRHFASDSADSYAVGTVDVARWEQFGLDGTLRVFTTYWMPLDGSGAADEDRDEAVEEGARL